MLILSLRTDKPEAELGLFNDKEQVDYMTWPAHRELAETIHQKISQILKASKYSLKDLDAVMVYKGPGSFTGLRIGISVANALAASLDKPVVGSDGENWLAEGLSGLLAGEKQTIVVPEYGAPVRITQARK